MNHYQYDTLRAYAMEPLVTYLGTPLAYGVTGLAEKLSGAAARLDHEKNRAMELWACRDLTPQEKAAAHLLAVISNHRAISWWRAPDTPDGTDPLLTLEPWQKERLCKETIDAAHAYAAFLPERQATALLALVPEPQAAAPVPVVTDSASTTQDVPMKKAALIAALEYEWPSIEADLSEATRNGLKAAAHAGTHGEWDKARARAWAVSKGKIKQAVPAHHSANVWAGHVTKHRS